MPLSSGSSSSNARPLRKAALGTLFQYVLAPIVVSLALYVLTGETEISVDVVGVSVPIKIAREAPPLSLWGQLTSVWGPRVIGFCGAVGSVLGMLRNRAHILEVASNIWGVVVAGCVTLIPHSIQKRWHQRNEQVQRSTLAVPLYSADEVEPCLYAATPMP